MGAVVRCGTLKYIPFINSCFLELKKCGWNGVNVDGPLSMIIEGETAVLTYLGGDLYGLLVQNTAGTESFVDQFVTFRMACDFARAFVVK